MAVSNGVADDMCRVSGLLRAKVQTIYNPIDCESLLAMAREPLNHPWFSLGAPPVILGIGRMEKQKNFPNLVHAFLKIRQRSEVRLIVLGEGSERVKLTALVASLGLNGRCFLAWLCDQPCRLHR